MKTCRACGGQYEPNQAGGTYLHACAPVLDRVRVLRAGAVTIVTPDQTRATDVEVERLYVERADKVDETIRR